MNELTSIANPFRDGVVLDAWQRPADVESIHESAFNACIAGVEAASKGEPDSLLVFGVPGSGKTHLLTRVQRHLEATGPRAPDRVLRCIFVYARLQTAPQLLWQHLRRRLAVDLMRAAQGLTQLQRLVAHQLGDHQGEPPGQAVLRMRVLREQDPETLVGHLRAVAEKLALPRDLRLVIEHLVFNRWTGDASAWLAGDGLPEHLLNSMGLATEADADREASAQKVVLGLCRLAVETLPIVFCFDQVEALLRAPEDRDAFFRFGRVAADLHDADPNVCLMTCMQSTQIDALYTAVHEADLNRLAKRRIILEPLSAAQVESLVLARLNASAELRALREGHPGAPLFPFDRAFVAELASQRPCVARRVIGQCAARFEELQRGAPPRRVPDAVFLAARLDDRLQENGAPVGTGETKQTVVTGAQILAGIGRARVVSRAPGDDVPEIDLVLDPLEARAGAPLGNAASTTRIAVSVRDESDGRALLPRLAALVQRKPDGTRLVIVRDPRVPVSPRAVKVREHLATLRAQGAVVIEPTVQALAALRTLSAILAEAKSGDLANDGETVGESVVLAWLRDLAATDDARIAPIEELVSALFEQPPVSGGGISDEARQALADLVSRSRVLDLATASREIKIDGDRLLAFARQSPERYLVLGGPPTMLLDVAGVVAGVAGTEASR